MIKNCQHTTVLLEEAVRSLKIRSDGIYIDGTFGLGGHSRLILSQMGKKGILLAIDRDPQAVSIAKTINDSRFSIIHGTFSKLRDYVKERGLVGKINGILLDLGMSSLQLDNAERGFSFMRDGPLDMRMDPTTGYSVSELLKLLKEDDIAWILKTFGEERFAKRIAHAIARRNYENPITRTKELVAVVAKATPIKDRYKHIATRTFQAMRILVNNELEEIKSVLKGSLHVLSPGGRLSIITFHSLEDRIVKRFLYSKSHGTQISKRIPVTEEQLKKIENYQLQQFKKIKPSEKEIINNPRSRSSILRYAEKTNTHDS